MTLLLYLCVVVFCFAVMKCSCCSVVHGMVCHGIVLCSKYVMVLHCTTSFFSHCMCADYFSLIYCTIDDYSTLCLLYCSTTYNIASYYVILVFTGIFFWGVQNDVSHVATWLTRKKRLECWQMFRNLGRGTTLIFPPWCSPFLETATNCDPSLLETQPVITSLLLCHPGLVQKPSNSWVPRRIRLCTTLMYNDHAYPHQYHPLVPIRWQKRVIHDPLSMMDNPLSMIHNTMIILIVMVYHALSLLSITMIIQQLYHDCVMIIHYPLSI